MMKKLLAVLICLICLALPALAEEEVSVAEGRIVPQRDGSLLLHLVLHKTGPAIQLDDLRVVFLDAEGNAVPMARVTMHAAPLTMLHGGSCDFPVTLAAVPAKDAAEIVGFEVTQIITSPAKGSLPELVDDRPGYFILGTPRGGELTVYTSADGSHDAQNFMGFALMYDSTGAYLGNVMLLRGSAFFVPAAEVCSTLAEAVGWTERQLMEAGFPTDTPDSIFFDGVSMNDLPQDVLAGESRIFIFRVPEDGPRALEITAFNPTTQGTTFTNYAVLYNTTDELIRLREVPYVAFYDEDEHAYMCEDVTVMAPFWVLAPGESMPIIMTGTLPEGFVPVACGFVTSGEEALASDHERLADLTAPQDGDVSGCIAVLVCYDERNGSLLEALWTLPGEAAVADGRIVLSEEALVDVSPDGASLHMTFYRVSTDHADP